MDHYVNCSSFLASHPCVVVASDITELIILLFFLLIVFSKEQKFQSFKALFARRTPDGMRIGLIQVPVFSTPGFRFKKRLLLYLSKRIGVLDLV